MGAWGILFSKSVPRFFVLSVRPMGQLTFASASLHTHSAAARAVEDEEKQNDDDDPEELFVFKNVAEASHDSIPFYFHLDFSPRRLSGRTTSLPF